VLVPGLVAREQQRADVQDQALEARDVERARQVQTHADAVGQTVHDYADAVGAAVRAYALSLAVQNRQLELADLAALTAAVQQLVAATLARVEADLGQARADAAEQDAIVQAVLTQMVTVAEQEARDLVLGPDGAVVRLEGELQRGDQATLNAALAGAGALVTTVAVAVDAIQRSPCMQRCNSLGSLGTALEAIDLAALLLLVAEAGRKPGGSADIFESVFGGPIAFATQAFHTLAGQ
jgi:hypothetical protein